jgi:hypothetical protein
LQRGLSCLAVLPNPPILHTQFCSIIGYNDANRYDPYVPRDGTPSGSGGPSSGPAGGTNPNNTSMQKAKDEIERTKKIMEDNIRNVAERGDRLDALRDKTGEWKLSFLAFWLCCQRMAVSTRRSSLMRLVCRRKMARSFRFAHLKIELLHVQGYFSANSPRRCINSA